MKRRLILWAMRLYPASWRDRYSEEFAATVEQIPSPSLAVVWDITRSALIMRAQQGATMKKSVIAFALLGLAISWGISLRIADQYLSQSVLQSAKFDRPTLDQSIDQLLSRQSLTRLMEKHELYKAERCCLPLEDIVEMMKRNVSVSLISGQSTANGSIAVGFKYPDPEVARKVASDLSANLILSAPKGHFTLVDAASASEAVYPNRKNIAFAGLLAGTIAGAGWAFVRSKKSKLAS